MRIAKGWRLVAAAWIGLAAAGAAHAVNWVNIGKAPDAEGYIDIDSFARPGTTPSFWLTLRFTEPQRESLFAQPWQASRARYDVSCREQLVRIMNYSRLTDDGKFVAAPRINPVPMAYTPGTLLAWSAQFTCLLVDHRLPTVDLRLAGGAATEQEFSGKDGTTSVSFPPAPWRNGRLLARVKLVSSSPEYLPSGKEYKTSIQYMLTDCSAGTHRIVARSRFGEDGKGVTAQLWPPDGPPQDFEDPALKDYLLNSCKTMEARGPSGGERSGTSSGSGFAITKDGYVVTNHHVIDGCGPIQVRLPGTGQQVPGTVRWSDKRNDIAVLKVDRAMTSVAEMRARPLSLGDQVMAFGFPYSGVLASEGVFSAGMVSATAGLGDDTARLQISNPVQPGNSGGPLLDETGAVAGVIVSKLDAVKVLLATGDIPQNINFAVKGEVVRLLLDTYGVQYAPGKGNKKLEPREIADRAKSFTVLITCTAGPATQTAAARQPAAPGAAPSPAPAAAAAGAAGAAATAAPVGSAPTVVASTAPTPVAAGAEGMPARGARWRYSYRDERYSSSPRYFSVEVMRVDGTRVQERFMVEGGDITQGMVDGDLVRFVSHPLGSSVSVIELAPYSQTLYNRGDAKPAGYPASQGVQWDIGRPTYGEESVTVPAGTYNTVRVEVSGTMTSFGSNTNAFGQAARFTYVAWYSQELKRYVKIRHQTWARSGQAVGDEIVQLTSYQPGK